MHVTATSRSTTAVGTTHVEHVEPRHRDRSRRELDVLARAHPGVGAHAVDLDRADRRRHLLDGAGERATPAAIASSVTPEASAVAQHLALGVVGDGRDAEPDRGVVGLVGEREVAEQPGGALEPEDEHAGGHRVERAGMADLAGAGEASHAGDDVVAGHPGGLVDDDQAVRRPCGPRGVAAPRAQAPRCADGGRARRARRASTCWLSMPPVNPAAKRCPPPPSASATGETSTRPCCASTRARRRPRPA